MLINFLNDTNKVKTIICLPDTGYTICDKLKEKGCNKKLIKAKNMQDAVKSAYLYTKKGMACMLTPAAASYNVYKNFEERGKHYKELICKYKK